MDLAYELGSLIAPVGTGILFWLVLRAILRADRRQRETEAQIEKELRAERAARREGNSGTGPSPSHPGG
ncbi:hypothetical protein JSY14_11450 [Brachybacterium sp. EF45031]|uniref:hypothetical protein n=1 Tax=Brachybacterium sillae TaxID=2810536 RepID=UPI00217ECD44|nr:hypothetical protein [Brachybacterium sillae]MCS6712605.1 hypothetical protein [Brachybacterium sillae]